MDNLDLDLSLGTSEKDEVHPHESTDKRKGEKLGMKPILLKVPAGVDIIDWVVGFGKSRKVCITVCSGNGTISQATLSHLGSQDPPLTYTEHLNLITISGASLFSCSAEGYPTIFNAILGNVNGAIIGGTALRMVTKGDVLLSAHVFENPEEFTFKAELQ